MIRIQAGLRPRPHYTRHRLSRKRKLSEAVESGSTAGPLTRNIGTPAITVILSTDARHPMIPLDVTVRATITVHGSLPLLQVKEEFAEAEMRPR